MHSLTVTFAAKATGEALLDDRAAVCQVDRERKNKYEVDRERQNKYEQGLQKAKEGGVYGMKDAAYHIKAMH